MCGPTVALTSAILRVNFQAKADSFLRIWVHTSKSQVLSGINVNSKKVIFTPNQVKPYNQSVLKLPKLITAVITHIRLL